MTSMWVISSLCRASFVSMMRSWWKIASITNNIAETLMVRAMGLFGWVM